MKAASFLIFLIAAFLFLQPAFSLRPSICRATDGDQNNGDYNNYNNDPNKQLQATGGVYTQEAAEKLASQYSSLTSGPTPALDTGLSLDGTPLPNVSPQAAAQLEESLSSLEDKALDMAQSVVDSPPFKVFSDLFYGAAGVDPTALGTALGSGMDFGDAWEAAQISASQRVLQVGTSLMGGATGGAAAPVLGGAGGVAFCASTKMATMSGLKVGP